ncbi:RCC1/BLIP-II protein [Glonium stellatum]|uniref:RCC1/BLIP-II protein n=1 Tax=Glonium stellatum TaxID=574774 RepID=A0A8E2ERX9_9PEZI|nr:RCC1/BLIP-II protein [Glonium stellatum]
MLFAFGSNSSGQLGIGHRDDVSVPTLCIIPPSRTEDGSCKKDEVACITAGGNHTLVQRDSGVLYGAGDNTDGRCHLIPSHKAEYPSSSPNLSNLTTFEYSTSMVKRCAATWEASAIITTRESATVILTCGAGNRGELGQGFNKTNSNGFEIVSNHMNTTPIDIAGGMSHFAAVMSNGDVYGWGSGRKGQIGEPKADCWSPRKIEGIPFRAVRVVCGRDFTYIVGSPDRGEHLILGSDKFFVRSAAPTTIPTWNSIGASWGGIYVLLESGALLSWGRNDHGQLPPRSLPELDQIAVGSEHVIALSKTGKVLAWGWGEHGNCGSLITPNNDVTGCWNEIQVQGRVLSVGAGCATSWIDVEE